MWIKFHFKFTTNLDSFLILDCLTISIQWIIEYQYMESWLKSKMAQNKKSEFHHQSTFQKDMVTIDKPIFYKPVGLLCLANKQQHLVWQDFKFLGTSSWELSIWHNINIQSDETNRSFFFFNHFLLIIYLITYKNGK